MTAALASLPDLLGTSPADLLPDCDRHDSTPDEARQRADRLRAGIVRYSEMRQDIADAFACRDWIALGYDNWPAYVEAEFGEQLAQLGRGERRQAIGDLREQGMSTRQIAAATGMPQSTVSDNVRQLTESGQLEQPERITGTDGRERPSTRPTPTPGPVDTTTSPADPGVTPAPAAESPVLAAPREPDQTPEHYEARGWKGDGPGSCGVECGCGVGFDGFDSLAEAQELLDLHIETPEPADVPSTAPAGPGSGEEAAPAREGDGATSKPTPPPGSPATWTDEQREANRLEIQRKAAIAACERTADALVLEISGMVTTIIDGLDFGAPGIPVTMQMIDECREALDRLEARVIGA